MNRLSLAAAGVAAALLALSACSSSSSGGAGGSTGAAGSAPAGGAGSAASPSMSMSMPAAPATSDNKGVASGKPEIKIQNFGFSGSLTVKAGAKVEVVNEDSVAHTLTDKATHKFDTGNIAGSGGTGTFTAPSKPGSYPFGCNYHPQMAGTLVVTG